MLLVKIESKGVAVEKLAVIISKVAELGFRVWLYDKKVYATFTVNSITSLRQFTARLRRIKTLEFKLFRVEEFQA